MKDLSLNVLDVAHNSISAGASLIEVTLAEEADLLTISIKDNGCGIAPEMLKTVTDPFTTSRTTRKVGMGLPLFKLAAQQSGGDLTIESTVGVGTVVNTSFFTSNIDCPPIGDMGSTAALLAGALKEGMELVYTRIKDGRSFVFDTREVRAVLGGISLGEPEIQEWIRAYVTEQEESIKTPLQPEG